MLTRDGWCGLCYEHSCAEGIVVIQIVEQILQCIASENQKEDMVESLTQTDVQRQGSQDLGAQALGMDSDSGFPAPEESAPTPTRLEWKVTPVIYRRIQESADHLDR